MNDPLTAYYVIRLLTTISFLIIIIIIGAACLYTYFEILVKKVLQKYIITKSNYNISRKEYYKALSEKEKLIKHNESLKYSMEVLKQTKEFISQYVVCEFSTFIDNRDISKVTLSNIRSLAEELAVYIHISLNTNAIDWENVIFSSTYYDKFIINTTIMFIKKLFEEVTDQELV